MKTQTSIEFLLLLAGVLFLIALVAFLMKQTFSSGKEDVNALKEKIKEKLGKNP